MSQQSFEFLASETKCSDGAWTISATLCATQAIYDRRLKDNYTPPASASTESDNRQVWAKYVAPTPALLDALPHGSLLVRVDVKLLTPFYSRDDLPFYPTENALKRHKVFDTPYLSASGIKGLLRWAYRMANCTLKLEEDANAQFLFGVTNDTDDSGTQGALYCYPVFWTGKVGLEVINPQDKKTGAGTNPIKYEVVKAGARGTLWFLLVNLPGRATLTSKHIEAFLGSLRYLLDNGGLSAKSSAGWGSVDVTGANAALRDMGTHFTASAGPPAVQPSTAAAAAAREAAQQIKGKDAEEAWKCFVKDGELLPLEGNDAVFTNKRIKAVLDCSNSELKDKTACYARLQEKFKARSGVAPAAQSPAAEAKTQTGWLWPESGESAWSTFTQKLRGVLEAKEQQA